MVSVAAHGLPSAGQRAPIDALIDDLRSDDVGGNAIAAFTELLLRARGDGAVDPEVDAALRGALESADHQQRQFATVLLAYTYRSTGRPVASWPRPLLQGLVEALADDDLRELGTRTLSNARMAADEIQRLLDAGERLPEALLAGLEAALSTDDEQQRQYAAWLLSSAYGAAGRTAESWPDTLIEALVDGLRDDRIQGAAVFANGRTFFDLLRDTRDPRIEGGLERLRQGSDRQAKRAAVFLLAGMHAGSLRPDLAFDLLDEMADDTHRSNQYGAFRALRTLGRASVESLTTSSRPIDAQQAALLTLLSAEFELAWQPAGDHVLAWARSGAGAPISRIALAAAFVLGPAGRESAGVSLVPAVVRRMDGLSESLRTPTERLRWAASWFWFLDFDGRFFPSVWERATSPF